MKKALIMIAAALFIFAGCQKEKSVNESTSNNVIHIGVKQLAPPTKVAADDISVDEVTFHWEEGDKVAFVDFDEYMSYFYSGFKGEEPESTVYSCTDPTNKTFSGPGLDPTKQYYAFYPAEMTIYLNPEGVLYEDYRGNQIPKQHGIFALVKGDASEFTLDKHSSMIHISLTGNAKIGSIEFCGKENEKDIDVFSVLSCGDGVQLSNTPTDFYIDYVGNSNDGLTLLFKDTSDKEIARKKSTYEITEINQGKITDFPTIEINTATE